MEQPENPLQSSIAYLCKVCEANSEAQLKTQELLKDLQVALQEIKDSEPTKPTRKLSGCFQPRALMVTLVLAKCYRNNKTHNSKFFLNLLKNLYRTNLFNCKKSDKMKRTIVRHYSIPSCGNEDLRRKRLVKKLGSLFRKCLHSYFTRFLIGGLRNSSTRRRSIAKTQSLSGSLRSNYKDLTPSKCKKSALRKRFSTQKNLSIRFSNPLTAFSKKLFSTKRPLETYTLMTVPVLEPLVKFQRLPKRRILKTPKQKVIKKVLDSFDQLRPFGLLDRNLVMAKTKFFGVWKNKLIHPKHSKNLLKALRNCELRTKKGTLETLKSSKVFVFCTYPNFQFTCKSARRLSSVLSKLHLRFQCKLAFKAIQKHPALESASTETSPDLDYSKYVTISTCFRSVFYPKVLSRLTAGFLSIQRSYQNTKDLRFFTPKSFLSPSLSSVPNSNTQNTPENFSLYNSLCNKFNINQEDL